ncbi:holin [Dunaliella viridis virus SI2]|uniref:holin n=1 Tax=Dunaliella viridis virus SI2 TaxID=754069 RepID=UPI0002C11F65|nr:holin [Dunaliella viridis virus SI2]AGH16003.1 hypothetical protein DVVG_00017 [Dunaliella viridis virus SI2]
MKLVSNWRSFWRWHSTHAMLVLAALPFVWAELPHDLKSSIPESWLPWVAGGVFIAGIVGRLRNQGGEE